MSGWVFRPIGSAVTCLCPFIAWPPNVPSLTGGHGTLWVQWTLNCQGVALCPACDHQVSSTRSLGEDLGNRLSTHLPWCCGVLTVGHLALFLTEGPVSETGSDQARVKKHDFQWGYAPQPPVRSLLFPSTVVWTPPACAGSQGWVGGPSVSLLAAPSPVVYRPVGLPWLVTWPVGH